jgi:hypothetical protein
MSLVSIGKSILYAIENLSVPLDRTRRAVLGTSHWANRWWKYSDPLLTSPACKRSDRRLTGNTSPTARISRRTNSFSPVAQILPLFKLWIYFCIDSATRRRAACDFLQALCIFFESQVVGIYSQYIEVMQTVSYLFLSSFIDESLSSGIFTKSNTKLVEKRYMHFPCLSISFQRRNTKSLFNIFSFYTIIFHLVWYYKNKFIY